MSYTLDDWIERLRNRSDMSGYLYHLTKSNGDKDAMNILIKILNERKLIGSTTSSGFIVGSDKAVCFQDTTTYGLSQNSFHEQNMRKENKSSKVRYKPIGLAFNKKYVYDKGGRPVFYEKTDIAKKLLPQDEWWRIVNFDLSDKNNLIDWTHEREWRVKGDFKFDLEHAYVILVSNKSYKNFITTLDDSILKNLGGVVVLDPVLT